MTCCEKAELMIFKPNKWTKKSYICLAEDYEGYDEEIIFCPWCGKKLQ